MEMTYEMYLIKDHSATKNNVYLIVDKESRQTAIIDPACSMNQINELVLRLELFPKIVLLTHTHFDHIRRVNDLINEYNCDVYASRKEVEYYFYICENLHKFEDDEIINIGETAVKCLLTPGHTKGSACFLFENEIFTGDTLFIEGCGLCTGNGGSAVSMFHSIAKIKKLISDSVLVYPGHTYKEQPGKPVSYVKNNNIYYIQEDEKKFIEFRMRENQKNLFSFI